MKITIADAEGGSVIGHDNSIRRYIRCSRICFLCLERRNMKFDPG